MEHGPLAQRQELAAGASLPKDEFDKARPGRLDPDPGAVPWAAARPVPGHETVRATTVRQWVPDQLLKKVSRKRGRSDERAHAEVPEEAVPGGGMGRQ